MTLVITPVASRDLEEIYRYIAFEDPLAAEKVALRLFKAFDLLEARPEIGRPTAVKGRREWSVPGLPYLIPYRVRGDQVIIVRVFHTSRRRPQSWN